MLKGDSKEIESENGAERVNGIYVARRWHWKQ